MKHGYFRGQHHAVEVTYIPEPHSEARGVDGPWDPQPLGLPCPPVAFILCGFSSQSWTPDVCPLQRPLCAKRL